MLDAFIIERIRQEQEQKESGLQPLHIEVPRHPDDVRRWDSDEPSVDKGHGNNRGVSIIDFNI